MDSETAQLMAVWMALLGPACLLGSLVWAFTWGLATLSAEGGGSMTLFHSSCQCTMGYSAPLRLVVMPGPCIICPMCAEAELWLLKGVRVFSYGILALLQLGLSATLIYQHEPFPEGQQWAIAMCWACHAIWLTIAWRHQV